MTLTDLRSVVRVLKSGHLIQGKNVEMFEKRLADYCGVSQAVMVSSGTAALHVVLLALGIGPGDEVIVPAFTFPATANVIELVGATPVFVDISLDDFCIDVEQLESKISEKTKAIMPVHEFGIIADMEKITEISKKHGLLVIEDAACSLGSTLKGKQSGSFGLAGCFSFHPRKNITTGEGGAVITNDKALADKMRVYINHGISMVDGKRDFVLPGLNYRMTDFQAALGLSQMTRLGKIIKKRQALAHIYDLELERIKWIKKPERFETRTHTYQTYHVLVDDTVDRDNLIKKLKSRGVETNLGAQALHCLDFYKKKYHYTEADFPNAAKAYRKGLALPMGEHLVSGNIREISKNLDEK
jgi:dTDP-4-amino-4,6-dideoxygalactose transaminase